MRSLIIYKSAPVGNSSVKTPPEDLSGQTLIRLFLLETVQADVTDVN